MTREELLQRLSKYEWTEIEFKEAQWAVPRNAYETVSAFANTAGGWLVFGVEDRDHNVEIVGVLDVDRVQNEFLSTLRSGKVNRVLAVEEQAMEHDGRTLLIFRVPEVHRTEKPVYLDDDIRKSFIRRGGTDQRCTREEIERFLRDAADRRFDGQPLPGLDVEECFDRSAVAWYRRVYKDRSPGRHEALSDTEFLHEWGFIVEHEKQLAPTRAGILVFGEGRYVRQILPRPVLDWQFIDVDFDAWSPERRWVDRIVVEENLVQAWLTLVERYGKYAERPFGIDAGTLRRDDDPPDYISFREAAINLLTHQDYGDLGRTPRIQFFRDRTVFWNPGCAFATTEELLDPTGKEVRNPAIVGAFRRIGLSEQAGTGVRAIFRNWQDLGHVPPVIENDKATQSFGLQLRKEPLLSEEQRLVQAQLGAHLDELQARVLALAWKRGTISLAETKGVTVLNGPEARRLLDTLVVQALLVPLEEGALWALAPHLRERAQESVAEEAQEPGLVSDQAGGAMAYLVSDQVLTSLTAHQVAILKATDVPRTLADLMETAGVTHRTHFRRRHLQPLLDAGLLRMTDPEHPQSPTQKYVLTDAGLTYKAGQLDRPSEDGGGEA